MRKVIAAPGFGFIELSQVQRHLKLEWVVVGGYIFAMLVKGRVVLFFFLQADR
jgi:hypothetical protein